MPSLTGQQVNALAKVLAKTINFQDLKMMVYVATGDAYDMYIPITPDGQTRLQMIQSLLVALEEQGITEKFLLVVYQERPSRDDVREAIAALFPQIPGRADRPPTGIRMQKGGVPEPVENETAGPGLQKFIRPNLKTVDLRVWLDRVEAIERQVCRVDVGDDPLGTGFLVGPSLVLTNWHVVQEARDAHKLDKLVCRFDYRRLSNNSADPGKVFPVKSVLDERRCSDAELTNHPDEPPPKDGELDYALLLLAESPGADRGRIAMVGPPISADDPLIIVQHPAGEPVQFAVDTSAVTGYVHGDRRLRYRTNTKAGSSGSPCFNMDLDLVALHHLGDPRKLNPVFNQGIPIRLVRDSLIANGHGAMIG